MAFRIRLLLSISVNICLPKFFVAFSTFTFSLHLSGSIFVRVGPSYPVIILALCRRAETIANPLSTITIMPVLKGWEVSVRERYTSSSCVRT